jgi:two-component sensor histidine kinase
MNEHLLPDRQISHSSIRAELARVRDQATQIAQNGKLLGAQIPLPRSQDLQDLTVAFNTLSTALHRSQIELNRSIQDRAKAQKETQQELLIELAESRHEAEELSITLRERTVLLQEIHHRVKNNLQVISSLLDMQSLATQDPSVEHILQDSRNQVKAVALVHEALYLSADLASINLKDYVHNLTGHLLHVYGSQAAGVTIRTEVDPVSLNIDIAIPCALLLNELVSNALIHAFPVQGNERGQIRVEFHALPEGRFTLTVSDNGVGLPPGFSPNDVSSLGMQLVTMLTQQLDGTLTVDHSSGTTLSISFSARQAAMGEGRT